MAIFDQSSKSFNTHLTFPIAFDDHLDSGVCSPPLWRRTSPPKSPPHVYQNLSPVSKSQVIARGQRELMEMVSKMPESCYELSLKDLVEVNTEEEENGHQVFDEIPQRKNKPRKTKSDRWVDPRGVKNGGFLLKLVFPVSLGAKTTKKKKKTKKKIDDDDDCSVTSRGSLIHPRRSVSDVSMKSEEDRDWWKKRLSESCRSQRGASVSRVNSGSSKSSGGSSSRSNSDRSRRISPRDDEKNGCLSFLKNVHLRN
ncbi:unnamed protein product [Cochlearia groenlandica]